MIPTVSTQVYVVTGELFFALLAILYPQDQFIYIVSLTACGQDILIVPQTNKDYYFKPAISILSLLFIAFNSNEFKFSEGIILYN